MKRQRKKFIIFLYIIFMFCVALIFMLHIIYGMGEDRKEDGLKLFPVMGCLQEKKKSEPAPDRKNQRKKTIDDSTISVLIKTQGFSGFYHKTLQITSDASFAVYRDGNEKVYHAGERICFSAKKIYEKYAGKTRAKRTIKISPLGNGKLKVCSFKRMERYPVYRGSLKLRVEKKGLILVNKLCFREYLYAVVSSEISSSSMEALKAQAICARTYAANKRRASEYETYGAELDDSDTCQVYNNFPENARSRRAVRETEGLVLKKDGRKIPVYYFSTSWGYTASGKEVWNTEEEIPYLQRKFQITESCAQKLDEQEEPDLSGENAFRAFLDKNEFQDRTQEKRYVFETYDSKSTWYRWNIEILWKTLEQRLAGKIVACYEAYPNLVLFRKQENRGFQKGSYCEFGELKRIYPGKRDSSGLVTELIVEGSRCAVMIKTQYSIRRLLSFSDEKIVLADGTVRAAFQLLPSAAFYLERCERKGREYLLIKGGGFGHGTGMSQYGATVQAELGWSCEKILQHYFTGISIEMEDY